MEVQAEMFDSHDRFSVFLFFFFFFVMVWQYSFVQFQSQFPSSFAWDLQSKNFVLN